MPPSRATSTAGFLRGCPQEAGVFSWAVAAAGFCVNDGLGGAAARPRARRAARRTARAPFGPPFEPCTWIARPDFPGARPAAWASKERWIVLCKPGLARQDCPTGDSREKVEPQAHTQGDLRSIVRSHAVGTLPGRPLGLRLDDRRGSEAPVARALAPHRQSHRTAAAVRRAHGSRAAARRLCGK